MAQKEEKPNPESLIDESLIGAFCKEFTYTPYEFDADVVFGVGALRDFFKCWRSFGDTSPDFLPIYIKRLADLGYNRIVGCQGTPVIPVKRKQRIHPESVEEIE